MLKARLVAVLELAFIALILVLLLFPSPFMVVGFVGLLFWFGARWVATGCPLSETPINLPLLVLLAALALALKLSPTPDRGVLVVAQMLAGVLALFAALRFADGSPAVLRFAMLLVGLGLVLAAASPFMLYWEPVKMFDLPGLYKRVERELPLTANSNILGGALAPLVPLSLALIVRGGRSARIAGGAALALIAVALTLLQSRGALFALALGLAVWATLYRRWLLPFIPLALLLGLVANSALGGPSPAQLFSSTASADPYNSISQRQVMWVQAVYFLRQSPLNGIGLGAYQVVAPTAWPHSPQDPGWDFPHVHNTYLQVALDTGIIGAVAFVLILAVILGVLWRAYRAGNERDLAIGLLAAMAIVLLHGLEDNIMWGSKSSLILWLLFALALQLDKKRFAR